MSGKVWPSREFEEWFAGVEAGDGEISVPQSAADGQAWFDYIERRQIALGAWDAAIASQRAADAQSVAAGGGVCVWTPHPDHDYIPQTWDSECGETWSFTEGGPEDNNFRFCHGCGKPVATQHGENT